MSKLLITLLITSLPSMAFAYCAAQADDALYKLRNAHEAINESYEFYDAGQYDKAITQATRAKDKVREGRVSFEIIRDRGVCDWEGPSLSEVNHYIRNTKISTDQANCVVLLSKMGRKRADLRNIYKSMTAEARKKTTGSIQRLGNKALGVCEDGWHKHIKSIIEIY